MRRMMTSAAAMAAAAAMVACSQGSPVSPNAGGIGSTSVQTGNGAPSGSHYNLNLIGVPREKSADMDDNSGHRIFVKLEGNTKILLGESPDDSFNVIDANGTDGEASFELPNPDPDNLGTTRYSVFARALGTPGGSGTIVTCATDIVGGDEECSLAVLDVGRERGRSTFKNVSKELLYIYADIDGNGVRRFPLFDDELQDYFWSYDNDGLKLVQLRFYPCATTVPDPENYQDPVTTACFD